MSDDINEEIGFAKIEMDDSIERMERELLKVRTVKHLLVWLVV